VRGGWWREVETTLLLAIHTTATVFFNEFLQLKTKQSLPMIYSCKGFITALFKYHQFLFV